MNLIMNRIGFYHGWRPIDNSKTFLDQLMFFSMPHTFWKTLGIRNFILRHLPPYVVNNLIVQNQIVSFERLDREYLLTLKWFF